MNCKKMNNACKDKVCSKGCTVVSIFSINNIRRSIIMSTHQERDNEKMLPNTETACSFVAMLKFIQC